MNEENEEIKENKNLTLKVFEAVEKFGLWILEKLHLKLANWACHHSVRAGQKLDFAQMDLLLRDIERTERGGQCNHGRPVYKFIPITEIDTWFERL